MYPCVYIYISPSLSLSLYIYIYIYVCTHAYIYIYIAFGEASRFVVFPGFPLMRWQQLLLEIHRKGPNKETPFWEAPHEDPSRMSGDQGWCLRMWSLNIIAY